MSTIINQYLKETDIKHISEITHSFTVMDNNKRAAIITEYMDQIGFCESGIGTNRACYKPYNNSGIIFKIALDERGIEDNNAEYQLSEELYPDVTKSYENNGYVSVAEAVDCMDSEMFDNNRRFIYPILQRLSLTHLLSDVGPKSFKNWGLRGAVPVILDYAYLVPKTGIDFRCLSCNSYLEYDPDFSVIQCPTCKRKHTISDIAHTASPDEIILSQLNTNTSIPSLEHLLSNADDDEWELNSDFEDEELDDDKIPGVVRFNFAQTVRKEETE